MTTIFVRPFALAALAALTLASGVIAQNRITLPLSDAEGRRLISSAEPADHARLGAHFAAEAERYAADAKRHASMQQAFAGNTKLAHIAASQAAHCQQLASRNLESATTLRELAAHHNKLAAGLASAAPRGGERFERAAGVRAPTDAELTRLAGSATTAADHQTLAGYFASLATGYERDAKESAAYASSWRSLTKNPSAAALAARWERVAKQQSDAAAEARSAAKMHRDHAASTR